MIVARAIAVACAIACAGTLAQTPAPPPGGVTPPGGPTPPPGMSQGELLYTTHCVGCHTKDIHWRDNKIAKDWPTLLAQVRRWQASGHLNWGEEEIAAVAHYLNRTFYKFPEPEEKKVGLAGLAARE